jgi:hypothetical protein
MKNEDRCVVKGKLKPYKEFVIMKRFQLYRKRMNNKSLKL